MVRQRARRGFLVLFACGLLACIAVTACKSSDVSTDSSKGGGFRLSLSKRENPIPNKAAH